MDSFTKGVKHRNLGWVSICSEVTKSNTVVGHTSQTPSFNSPYKRATFNNRHARGLYIKDFVKEPIDIPGFTPSFSDSFDAGILLE